MRSDLQNLKESYSRNVLRENVDRLEFLKNKYLPLFYGKLLHVWPDESNLPSDYNVFKTGLEKNPKFKAYESFLNETVDNLISADPYSKVDMEKGAGYAGQYSEWILKTFLKKFDEKGEGMGKTIQDLRRFLNEDLSMLNSDLKIYDKNKTKVTLNKMNVRDINQIKDFNTLYYIVKKFIPKYEEEGIRDKSKVRTLLDNSQYFVGVPLTMYASQTLGNNARWCTSTRNEGSNQFDYYNKQGPLYVVHLKTKPEVKKFQFHFPSGQYMNEDNRPINVFDFFSKHPIVGQVIQDDYKKTEPKDENLRKAELVTGGLSVLEKEPDQFFQNMPLRNIVTMIIDGTVNLENISKGAKILSDGFDNKVQFDEDGMQVVFGKTDYDEFMDNFYNNDYHETLLTVISRLALNPLVAYFDDDPGENMVPFVLNPESKIFNPQQISNIRRVYDDIGETPEDSHEFYNICDKVLSKYLKPLASEYKKKAVDDVMTKRGIRFEKQGRKMAVSIPYNSLVDIYDEQDDTTVFNILENPSYYVKVSDLFPSATESQIEAEKTDFNDFISQKLDKQKVAQEILQKIDKK